MENFITLCRRTESPVNPLDPSLFPNSTMNRLLHSGIGIATESGEFLDAMKKALFYGREVDTVNLKEELGDLLWYIAIAMDALETDFPTEIARVINKLQVQFPDKFSEHHAANRDLDAERKELEK